MRKFSLVLAALIAFSLAPATALAQNGGNNGISSGATTNVFTNGVFSGAGTPNDPTTGTDLGATAKFVNNTGVVNLKKCGTTDTMCFKVTKETAGGTTGVLTGNAYVDGAFAEADTCSNACVVNNWVKESTTAAGQVMDTGTVNTSPCPSGATCLGFAMTAGSGLQTIVRLSPVVGVAAGGTSLTSSLLYTVTNTGSNPCATNACAGTATDQQVYQFTSVASPGAGKCYLIDLRGRYTTATAVAKLVKIQLGAGTPIQIDSYSGVNGNEFWWAGRICNDPGVQNAQHLFAAPFWVTTAVSQFTPNFNSGSTFSIDWTSAQTITIIQNQAATETTTWDAAHIVQEP